MATAPTDLSEVITLDAVWSVLEGVWESLLGAIPMPVPPSDDVGPQVWATVAMHGGADALVTFSCPRRTAEHMAKVMLASVPTEELDEDDVRDAVAETCNVIAGNVKSLLAEHADLGLPQVGSTPPDLPGAVLQQHVDVCWPDHRALVTVWQLPPTVARETP